MRRLMALASAFLMVIAGSTAATGAQRGANSGRGSRPPNGITGRVVDPSGTPVKGTSITALWPAPERPYGIEPVSVRLQTETDEQGNFVLDGLALGEYYVIAVPRNPAVDATGRPNASGYANTFHPSAVRLVDAARVRVAPFTRVTANITLTPARLRTVTGTVTGAAGQLVPGGRLMMGRGDGLFGLFSGAIPIRPDGSFALAGLQPGTYYLHFRESAWPPPRGVAPDISGATVVVKDANIANVRVVPIPMVRGSGRIVIDAAARPTLSSSLRASEITVGSSPIDFSGNPGPQLPGAVKEDLTFEFRTWPSVGRLRVSGLPGTWTVKAIRVNGVDATDKPIDFVAGKDVVGIEIELIGGGPR